MTRPRERKEPSRGSVALYSIDYSMDQGAPNLQTITPVFGS